MRKENKMNDLISRQAAIDAIKDDKIDLTNPNEVAILKATGDFEKAETQVMTCDRHIKILKELPPAPLKRMKGYWLSQDFNKRNGNTSTCVYYFPKCSVCGHVGNERFAFCPNCGADMRGERNEP